MIRVYVDYNEYDKVEGIERVYINTDRRPSVLKHLGVGLRVTVYDCDSLEYEATIGFDEKYKIWYAVVDDTTRRDLPPIPNCPDVE
jgi:hypothetical protein